MDKGESARIEKRDTVGKLATDLLSKDPVSRDPIELTNELLTDYEKELRLCIDRHIRDYGMEDFYVIVITKKEPLLENVLRHYFFARRSCPTPDYDQAVYKYTLKNDHIEFLWVIPSKDACLTLTQNASLVAPEEYGLLDYVLKFADGSLFALAKKLNGEKDIESSELVS